MRANRIRQIWAEGKPVFNCWITLPGMLAAEMLGCPGDGIRVRKASLIGIECPSLRPGAGQLQFSIPNAFLA